MKSILPLGYSPGTSVDVALSTGERADGHFAALPIDLIQAFIYLIIASAMEAFVSISETMAQALFSSGYGVAQSVSHIAGSASQAMLSTVGLDDATQGNRKRRIEGMIPYVKRMMSQDRTAVEIKDKKESDKKNEGGGPKSEILKGEPGKTKGRDKEDA